MALRNIRLTTLSGLAMMVAALLLVAVACGDDATSTPSATSTPVVIRETVEVTKVVEVTKEVPVTVVVSPTPRFPPTGTVTVAYHDFSRELGDKSLEPGSAMTTIGNIYDVWIGATPQAQLSTDLGVLDSFDTTDLQTFTFTLKQGIKWHDGVEMTSDDIKFSLEHLGREEAVCSTCGLIKRSLDRVEIVDRYTATVHFTAPNVTVVPAFGPVEGDLVIFPKHYYEAQGEEGFDQNPLASGPWKYVNRRIGEFIEFEANNDYWNSDRVPGFAELRINLVSEPSTRVAQLRTGEVDLASLNAEDVDEVKAAGFRIMGPKRVGYSLLYFYGSASPDFLTNKLEFRKAVALGVDWDTIVEAFYPPEVGKRYVGGSGLFPEGSLGSDPTLAPYPYRPEEAKQLLAQSGYNGERVKYLSFGTSGNPEQPDVNESIAGYLRDLGLNLEFTPVDYAGVVRPKFNAKPQTFEPPAVIGVQFPSSRPSVVNNVRIFMISQAAGGVIAGYWNLDKIDSIYADISTIVDIDERTRRLLALNRELYEEYWSVPIQTKGVPFGVGPRIADWQPTNLISAVLNYNTLTPAP